MYNSKGIFNISYKYIGGLMEETSKIEWEKQIFNTHDKTYTKRALKIDLPLITNETILGEYECVDLPPIKRTLNYATLEYFRS